MKKSNVITVTVELKIPRFFSKYREQIKRDLQDEINQTVKSFDDDCLYEDSFYHHELRKVQFE